MVAYDGNVLVELFCQLAEPGLLLLAVAMVPADIAPGIDVTGIELLGGTVVEAAEACLGDIAPSNGALPVAPNYLTGPDASADN